MEADKFWFLVYDKDKYTVHDVNSFEDSEYLINPQKIVFNFRVCSIILLYVLWHVKHRNVSLLTECKWCSQNSVGSLSEGDQFGNLISLISLRLLSTSQPFKHNCQTVAS